MTRSSTPNINRELVAKNGEFHDQDRNILIVDLDPGPENELAIREIFDLLQQRGIPCVIMN